MPERKIFRQSAITAYQRGIEKDVIPRLISWPIIVCLWLLLGVFIAAGFLAWYAKVPTYVDGSGIILAREHFLQRGFGEAIAVVFLPPDQSEYLRVGLPADIQVGSAGVYENGTIVYIERTMSPDDVRKSFQLDEAGALLITQPSAVVIVRLDTSILATTYEGSLVTVRVEIGSQRLLEMIPGLGKYLTS